MKDLGVKFTFYDFLGYFVPGFLFCFLVIYNDSLNTLDNKYKDLCIFKLVFIEVFIRIRRFFSEDGIIIGGTAIIMTYIIGHVITFLGYYLIEYPIRKFNFIKSNYAELEEKRDEKYFRLFQIKYKPLISSQHIHQILSEKMPASFETYFFHMTTAAYCRSFTCIFVLNLIIETIIIVSKDVKFIVVIVILATNICLLVLFFINYIRFHM